jgi:alpha-galactosidase
VRGTLPKVREPGLDWAALDDGWPTLTCDWIIDTGKFPRAEADMKAHGLKPRLWLAPLAFAPGRDQLHDYAHMLLLDKDGASQIVSWWNSFYLCPAYGMTLYRTRDVVRAIMGEWGLECLKIGASISTASRRAATRRTITHGRRNRWSACATCIA